MAKVILESTDTQYTIANNNVEVKGASGSQTLVVNSGVTGLSFDSTIEDVDFSGNVADYTFSQNGAGDLTVHDSTGTAIATISGANGKTLSFADGTVALETTFDAGTGTGGINLGGAAVGTTSAAVTPTTIDSSDTSSNASGSTPGQTFTLTTSTSGDLFTGTAGNDTFNGAAGTVGASDVLVDSTSTDADVANLTMTGTGNPQFTTANIETVNLNFELGATADASKVSGATVVNVGIATAGNTAATLLGLGSGVQNVVTSSDISTFGIQGTSSTSDTLKVTAGKSTLALNESTTEIENIEVATSGVASNVTVDVLSTTTVTKLVASGDADLTLTEATAGEFVLANVSSITDSTDSSASLTVKSVATGNADYSGVASTATLQLAGTLTGTPTVTLNNDQSSVKLSAAAGSAFTLAAKSGSSNTLNLVAAADQTNDLTTSGYTTVNLTYGLTDSTSASLGGIIASGATVNISGAGDFVLGDAQNAFSSLNAANATGNVNVLLTASATSFTGGAGADEVDLAADTSFTFVGGAGTDTLDIGAATLDLSNNDVSLSGVEVIDFSDATGTTTFAAKHLSGQTITFLGTSDAVAVTMTDTGDTADFSNVSQSGLSSLTLTGGAGSDSISGSKGDDTLLGAAGADTISGGNGADSITGGTGADSIDLAENVASIDTVIYTAANEYGDTVTNFAAGSGVDVIQFAQALAGSADTTLDGATAPTVSAGVITKSTFAVETSEAVLVSAAVNAAASTKAVNASSLTDLTKVATLMGETATFTDAGANAAETVLFVVEASDATSTSETFGVYSWTQGSAADVTVESTELSLVGVFSGTGTVTLSDITLV